MKHRDNGLVYVVWIAALCPTMTVHSVWGGTECHGFVENHAEHVECNGGHSHSHGHSHIGHISPSAGKARVILGCFLVTVVLIGIFSSSSRQPLDTWDDYIPVERPDEDTGPLLASYPSSGCKHKKKYSILPVYTKEVERPGEPLPDPIDFSSLFSNLKVQGTISETTSRKLENLLGEVGRRSLEIDLSDKCKGTLKEVLGAYVAVSERDPTKQFSNLKERIKDFKGNPIISDIARSISSRHGVAEVVYRMEKSLRQTAASDNEVKKYMGSMTDDLRHFAVVVGARDDKAVDLCQTFEEAKSSLNEYTPLTDGAKDAKKLVTDLVEKMNLEKSGFNAGTISPAEMDIIMSRYDAIMIPQLLKKEDKTISQLEDHVLYAGNLLRSVHLAPTLLGLNPAAVDAAATKLGWITLEEYVKGLPDDPANPNAKKALERKIRTIGTKC